MLNEREAAVVLSSGGCRGKASAMTAVADHQNMTEDVFDQRFDPLESPGQQEGSHFWERAEVLDALAHRQITEQHIWTVVDDGETMCAAAGWHAVNRLSYMVTRHPWLDGLECAVLVDYEEEELEAGPTG